MTPWGDDPEDSNCHGYTLSQDVGKIASPEEVIAQATTLVGNVMVFVTNGKIYHSGLFSEGILLHFLIGIGVLKSTIDDDLMGYDSKYLIPEDLDDLKTVVGYQEVTANEKSFFNLWDAVDETTYYWKHSGGTKSEVAEEVSKMTYQPGTIDRLKDIQQNIIDGVYESDSD